MKNLKIVSVLLKMLNKVSCHRQIRRGEKSACGGFKKVFVTGGIFLVSSCLATVFCLGGVTFDDGTVFITLTRKPEKIENLLTNIATVNTADNDSVTSHNAGQLLQSLPSIDISPIGTLGTQTSARIRNSTSDQVLVLINGLPVKGNSFGSANLAHFLADNIERIEVVYGPASVLYGANSVGGVINIITKKPISTKPAINIGLNYGSFNTLILNFNADMKKDKLGIFLTGTKHKSDGLRVNTNYDADNITLNCEYELNQIDKISLQGQFLNKKVGIPGKNFTEISDYDGHKELIAQTTNCVQLNKEYSLQLHYEKQFNGNITLNSKLYSTFIDHTYDQQDTNPSLFITPQTTKMRNKVLGCDLQLNLPKGLLVGYSFNDDLYDSWQKSIYIMTTDNAISTKKEVSSWAIFAQKTFSPANELRLSPGVRYNSHLMFGDQVIPQIAAILSINNHLKFTGNIGKSFRAPTVNDLFWPDDGFMKGNPELKPETAIEYDIGTEYSDINKSAKLTGFYREINDQIRWYPVDPNDPFSYWVPLNVDEAKCIGAELELTNSISKKLEHSIKFAHLDNTVRKKGEEDKGFQETAYSPKDIIDYQISYLLPIDLWLASTAKYVSDQNSGDGKTGIKLPAYSTISISIILKRQYFDASVSIENITNTRYVTRAYFPLPGITYSVGIKYKFSI